MIQTLEELFQLRVYSIPSRPKRFSRGVYLRGEVWLVDERNQVYSNSSVAKRQGYRVSLNWIRHRPGVLEALVILRLASPELLVETEKRFKAERVNYGRERLVADAEDLAKNGGLTEEQLIWIRNNVGSTP